MPDALSFMEIKRQHVELLPARTVMSMICCTPSTGTTAASGTTGTGSSTTGTTAAAGTGGAGNGTTITGNTIFVFFIDGNQYNTVTGGASGTTGAASTSGTATGGAS
ncbi:MAG TPA: hypothetical protein VF788_05045 [Pseudonocardiaceae bacterium]|jgi:hypothetical protein